MTMANNGLAKLIEELGELLQVSGKILAFGIDEHPDGNGNLLTRFEKETGDVLAAIALVVETYNVNIDNIMHRAGNKLDLFEKWHADPNI